MLTLRLTQELTLEQSLELRERILRAIRATRTFEAAARRVGMSAARLRTLFFGRLFGVGKPAADWSELIAFANSHKSLCTNQ